MNFQSTSRFQGAAFEERVNEILTSGGWNVLGSGKRHGVEIDIVAQNGDDEYFIECKGSVRGTRPGCLRHDTVRKALFTAYHLQSCGSTTPFLIITSHVPTKGATVTWINQALASGALTGIYEVEEFILEVES